MQCIFLFFSILDDLESWGFCENIEKHLQNSGAINRFLAHLVFVGLPGSGKTTLIARLLNLEEVEEMLKACASTGIMDGIITVNLKEDKASLHAANIDEINCNWQKVEFSLSCLRQMGVKHFATTKSNAPKSKNTEASKPQLTSSHDLDIGAMQPPEFKMADIENVLKKEGFPAVRPFLDNKSTLYLSDTGNRS